MVEFADIPVARGFVGDLNQVFLNLIVNAAHAIGDVVAGTDRKGVIGVRTYRDGDDLVVAISDTGGGIPEAIEGRVFDPFFTTKERVKGDGPRTVGIARAVVVDQHSGSSHSSRPKSARARPSTFTSQSMVVAPVTIAA